MEKITPPFSSDSTDSTETFGMIGIILLFILTSALIGAAYLHIKGQIKIPLVEFFHRNSSKAPTTDAQSVRDKAAENKSSSNNKVKRIPIHERILSAILRDVMTAYSFIFSSLMLMSFVPLWLDLILFISILVINFHIWNKFAVHGTVRDLLYMLSIFQAALILYGFVMDFDPIDNEWGRSDGDIL